MKKIIVLSAIMIAIAGTASAQDEGAAYSQGQSTVSVGYGFGNVWKRLFKIAGGFSGGNYKTSSTGPFSLTYEYGISEKFSVGAAVSYSQVKGKYTDASFPDDNYEETLTNFSVIARANYHFGSSEKFDPYIGAGLGYYNFKYEYKDANGGTTNGLFAVPGAFGFNAQLGARYYFAPMFGIFAEAGYVAGGFGQAGIVLKF